MDLQFRLRLSIYMAGVILIASCSAGKPEYSRRSIPKSADTSALRQTISGIRSIDKDLFEAGSFTGDGSVTIKYRLLRPLQHNSSKEKFPLVIVFHGSGAIGDDNSSQLGVLAKLWASPAMRAKYPAYVVAPQFSSRSSNYVMDSARGVLTSVPQPCLPVALQLLDTLIHRLNVDERRIYVIGYSMGGSSVINALSLKPGFFAGGVSISGIPQFDSVRSLASVPIWLMHGDKDTENPFSSDELFFKEVSVKHKTRFWVLENTAHEDVFSTKILGTAIPEWLFSKRTKAAH